MYTTFTEFLNHHRPLVENEIIQQNDVVLVDDRSIPESYPVSKQEISKPYKRKYYVYFRPVS